MNNKNLKELNKRISNLKKWMNTDLDISSALKLVTSLKIGLSLILPSQYLGNRIFQWKNTEYRRINRETLSLFLGQNKYFLKEVIKKARYNSNYIISREYLNKMERSVRINLSSLNFPEDIINTFLKKMFKDYKMKFNPPYSKRSKSKKYHPNLNENYFKKINTVEKAYWLGLLWADGWISKRIRAKNGNPNYIVGIKQSKAHKDLIKDYCDAIGFNCFYLKGYTVKKTNSGYYQAKFMNNRFASYLIKIGFIVGPEKSTKIKLPSFYNTGKLSNIELYLGFLLGYYDGDGTKGRTSINSGSIKLLNQIRVKFGLNNMPVKVEYRKKNGEKGKTYKLALGRELMCEMLLNFQSSFKPKRIAIIPQLRRSFERFVKKEILDIEEIKAKLL